MRVILAVAFLLAGGPASAETFDYVVKFKGALSGFSWAKLGNASIKTSKVKSCSGWGPCYNTRVTMSSKGSALLESIYPTRFFYQSYFQQKPLRTIAFEKREKKNKSKYQPYGYRHKLVTLSRDDSTATFHMLWSSGSELPATKANFVSKEFNGGKPPMVKKTFSVPVKQNALDRWALIHSARFLPYKKGYNRTFPGTNGTEKLTYRVQAVGKEKVEARGKVHDTWKVALVETKAGKQQPTLFLWITDDEKRLPLRVQMTEKIGKVRFLLQ